MRRRTLLAVGLSIPVPLLERVDDMLALPPPPGPPAGPGQIKELLAAARRQYNASALTALVAALPGLVATARDTAERSNTPAALQALAACYDLATDTLNKIGRKQAARITADRAVGCAERSGDPVAMGASARALGMMLRTEGRHPIALRVFRQAIDRLDATGLRTPAQTSVAMRLLCAEAYTAAWAGDRTGALDGIGEAERAAQRLERLTARPGAAGPFVALYRVDVHYALGDAGTALHAAGHLREGMFPTPERRARFHTDLARAWWQWGKPEETAKALLSAHRQAPAEVADRPSIRRIADELAARHARVPGVQELAAALSPGHLPPA
ncbi:transcriptional regulator [Spongiactinospora gelatinilytica]|uniref:Transcriptional regulator n=2 Tax=Spongiactinospora gelatinilytica TaxID=2666298 RepID=A0A2W2F6D6_9ACTN|nr:transcriptional regulator [Spongiactinospora gelatinilytica]